MGTLSTNLGLEETSSEDAQETPQVIGLLSSILEKTIQKNEKFMKRTRTKDNVTIFHGSRTPTMSIRQYMERIFKYSKCSPSCFVVAYVYMDRFLKVTSSCLTSLNAHRLLITCVLVAAKFLDDASYNNAYYAKVGGVSIEEMNKLEVKLVFSLDFRLHVTLETFEEYCLQLDKAGAKTGSRSGSYHIQRAIEACGFKGGSKFAAYTCRAI